jgi:hypothetical protein
MRSEDRGLKYRFVLPVAQLMLCFAVLWPMRNMIIFEVRSSMGKAQVPGPYLNSEPFWISPLFVPLMPWERFISPEVQGQMVWIPTLLNAPAMLVEIPYAMLGSKHSAWSPRGFDFDLWRAVTWPFGGLVFWWIAGRAIDALIAARRRLIAPSITWTETGVGVLSLASGVILCALSVMIRMESNPIVSWQLVALAGAIWSLLGAATIAARFIQWRLRHSLGQPGES